MYRRSILPVSGVEKWPKLIFWEPATFSRKTGHADVELYDRDVSSYFLLLSGCSLAEWPLFSICSKLSIKSKYLWNRHLTQTCMKFVTSTISCFKIVCTYTKYLHLFTSLVRVQVDCGYEKVLGKILFFTSISCPIPWLNFHNNVHPNRRNQDLPTWRVSRRTPPNTVASCRTPSSRSSWWSPMRPPGNNDLWKGDTSLIQMENCHQQYLIS